MANTLGRANRGRSLVRSRPRPESPVRRAIVRARQWAGGLALAFVALCVLVAAGATAGIDEWFSRVAVALAWYPADVAASVVGILGRVEVTGPIALLLAFLWWRRDGARGLVPLLFFVSIAIEVVLKHVIRHPGPPAELSRGIPMLSILHGISPYSFPSGHVVRTTFMAALLVDRWAFWTLAGAMTLSRVYLNEHWVSDVAGGFLLGASLAGLAASLYANPDA